MILLPWRGHRVVELPHGGLDVVVRVALGVTESTDSGTWISILAVGDPSHRAPTLNVATVKAPANASTRGA